MVSCVRWLALLLLCSCVDTGERDPVVPLDLAAYTASVHVIVEARCGTLDCHGVGGRPLRIFSENGLRLADDLRGQEVTPAELAANVDAFEVLDAALVIDKPLVGREAHEGGDVWFDVGEDEVVCLSAWLAGRSADAGAQAACERAKQAIDQGMSSST
jgi:hypothetical protein